MARVVQLTCPSCRQALRVPADWLSRPIRCKHCGTVIRIKPKNQSASATVSSSTPDPVFEEPPTVPQPTSVPVPTAPPAVEPLVFDNTGPAFRVPAAHRRPHRLGRWFGYIVLAGFMVTAGILIALAVPHLHQVVSGTPEIENVQSKQDRTRGSIPIAKEEFPRRLLAISVNNYLYANPVNYGRLHEQDDAEHGKRANKFQGRNLHTLIERLARSFRVPDSQVIELSDAAPGNLARPPFKPVIEQTLVRFLEMSRTQDRIILLFIGHAVELDNVPYLAPLEGDLADKETLIPFRWLYEQLAKCRAQHKLLILDVCRYDPSRGLQRPGGGDLGEKLGEMLKNPPDGVQVWTACAAGQRSYEFNNAWLNNGLFLEELFKAVGGDPRFKVKVGEQKPEDPLPLDELIAAVNQRTEQAALEEQKLKQTPRLTGTEKPVGSTFDPNEPLPEKLVIEMPSLPDGASPAKLDLIRDILRETADAMPPIRIGGDDPDRLKAENLPLLAASTLARYKADYADLKALEGMIEADQEKYPLRRAVLRVAALLRKQVETKDIFMTELHGTGPEVKRRILEDQRTPAKIHLQLTEALEELTSAGKARDQEPSKRWQANYDYTLARLLSRLAYYFEYNLILGKIRKDELPELGPNQKGWRLAAREKANAKEAREFAAEAKKAIDRLIKEHAGTPWEVLAKRESVTALGLEWQATSFGE